MAKLRRRAQRNGRSIAEEVRDILRDATQSEGEGKNQKGLGTEIAALLRGIGLQQSEEIQELRDIRLQIPDFEE
jgi:plasmid stability protein